MTTKDEKYLQDTEQFKYYRSSMVEHTYSSRTWFWGQPEIHSETQDIDKQNHNL